MENLKTLQHSILPPHLGIVMTLVGGYEDGNSGDEVDAPLNNFGDYGDPMVCGVLFFDRTKKRTVSSVDCLFRGCRLPIRQEYIQGCVDRIQAKDTSLHNNERIVRLFEAPPDVLKEKCVVISCSAYI